MIEFRQKIFSEYDAMKYFYEELKRDFKAPKIQVIDSSAIVPILKGNNIVIERFVISTSFANKDNFRMYIKLGAKVKMPDAVRLPGEFRDKKLFNLSLNIGKTLPTQKYFSGGNKKKNNNNDGGGDGIKTKIDFKPELTYKTQELLGDVIKYDTKERLVVIEFDDIRKAIKSLNVLPFGLNYKIYLLG